VPTRASTPSDTASSAFGANSVRHLGLVGLELLEGAPDRGVLGRGVLQLQHRQRQAIHEQHHVRPAAVLVLHHAELVHRQPVVARRVVEVDHPRLRAADAAVGVAVFHRHAVHQQAVQRAVAHDQVCAPIFQTQPRQLAEGIVQRLGRQRRVQPRERIAQAPGQHHLPVVVALGRGFAGGDLGAVADLPASRFQPRQRGLLDDGFGEGAHRPGAASMFIDQPDHHVLVLGVDSATSSASAASPTSLITGSPPRIRRPLRAGNPRTGTRRALVAIRKRVVLDDEVEQVRGLGLDGRIGGLAEHRLLQIAQQGGEGVPALAPEQVGSPRRGPSDRLSAARWRHALPPASATPRPGCPSGW
jgi:hypothetical protein